MSTETADNTGTEPVSSRIEAEREADQRADVNALLVIFIALVLGAVFFISGWNFDV